MIFHNECTMLEFFSITEPAKIDINHFHNKLLAFHECPDEYEYAYFYFGNPESALEFLESVGFKEIRIGEERPYSSEFFLRKAANS